MHTINLRKMGGSVMLAVPPPLLNLLQLGAGDPVNVGIENGRLIVQPKVGPKYTLDQLLSQCDRVDSPSNEDRAWLDAKPVGEELLQRGAAISGSLPLIPRPAMNSGAGDRC